MRDLLTRIQRALPAVEEWMAELHEANAARAVPAGATGFTRMQAYFPSSLLESARAVTVDAVPFPPVTSMGLPEFEALARMPMAGITFGHMYFVRCEHGTEGVHFHELVHVVQWRTLGVDGFLRAYGVGIARHGYQASPLEAAAFDLQARFERGEALPGLVDSIEQHAGQVGTETEELFRALGIPERDDPRPDRPTMRQNG